MQWFLNLRLTLKVFIVLGVTGLCGIAANSYTYSRSSQIESQYEALITHESQAAILAEQMEISVRGVGHALYRAIMMDDPALLQKQYEAYQNEVRDFQDAARQIREKLPERAGQVAGFETKFAALTKQAEPAMKLAVSKNNLEATAFMKQGLDAGLENLKSELEGFSNAIQEELLRKSDSVNASTGRTALIGLLTAVISTALVFILGQLVMRAYVLRPVIGATENIQKIAGGDCSVNAEPTKRRDEIGVLQNAMANLKETVGEAFRLKQMVDDMPTNIITADANRGFTINYANQSAMEVLRQLSSHLSPSPEMVIGSSVESLHRNMEALRGPMADPAHLPHRAKITIGPETLDMKISAMRSKSGDYLGPMISWNVITGTVKLADEFEASVGQVVQRVRDAAAELQSSAGALSSAASQTSSQSTGVSSAAEQTSGSVQTVAAATEELSASIGEISSRVQEGARIAGSAAEEATRTNTVVKDLADSASRIGAIVELINGIAEQINLLALNATIEAARAGDAGKGFAVVAGEVKALATQTAKATADISETVTRMQGSTNDAVQAIQSIGGIIVRLNEISSSIASSVEQQGAATREISHSVQRASDNTREVSSIIVQVSKAAGDSGQMATRVFEASKSLNEQGTTLAAEVEQFITRVRAL